MYISELYINQLTESAWKRRLAQGKLGKDSLRKIQKSGGVDKLHVRSLLNKNKISPTQAKQLLSRKGSIVKSGDSWVSGVNTGTENMMKKYGTSKVYTPDIMAVAQSKAVGDPNKLGLEVGKTMTNPFGAHGKFWGLNKGQSAIHTADPKYVSSRFSGDHATIDRHEMDELIQSFKQWKKRKGHYGAGSVSGHAVGGSHVTDKVLDNERKLTRTGMGLYGGTRHAPNVISSARKKSREYDILKSLTKNDRSTFIQLQSINDKIQTQQYRLLPIAQREAYLNQVKGQYSPGDFKMLTNAIMGKPYHPKEMKVLEKRKEILSTEYEEIKKRISDKLGIKWHKYE